MKPIGKLPPDEEARVREQLSKAASGKALCREVKPAKKHASMGPLAAQENSVVAVWKNCVCRREHRQTQRKAIDNHKHGASDNARR